MRLIKRLLVVTFVVMAGTAFIIDQLRAGRAEAKVFGGPPIPFTGAPGEGTCIGCHYTYGIPNPPGTGGSVAITGLPSNYNPGETYTVTITVAHPTARRWGFEVTAIGTDGTSNTIGNLSLIDSVRTIERNSDATGFARVYVSHYSEEGRPAAEDGTYPGKAISNSWSFSWTAPSTASGAVSFYAVGNAANNQVSPEDDFIYTTAATVLAPNHAPVFAALADRIAGVGDEITFAVTASDPDGNSLTLTASELAHSTFDPNTRRFTFIPSPDQIGTQTVTFSASDGQLDSSESVSLEVAAESALDITALEKNPSNPSHYLDHALSSSLTLTTIGAFGPEARVVFNGLALDSQAVQSGVAGTVPASELRTPGVYSVRVRLTDGRITRERAFVLASEITATPATTVDAASFQNLVAPGQIGAVFGANLIVGSQPQSASVLPLPASLRSTRAFVNGIQAPLFYVSNGQINLQIPQTTASGQAYVVVYREDGIAASGTIQVSSAVPGLFSTNSMGTGQGAILNADFSPNGDPSLDPQLKRAKRGDYVIIFGNRPTSLLVNGETGQPASVEDGAPSPVNPLLTLVQPASVIIGDKTVAASFSGLTPGFVALWQLNVLIPADAPVGNAIDLSVRIDGRTSNRVTIAIE
jgi:uncharacterized protein (TIGR03437 family)